MNVFGAKFHATTTTIGQVFNLASSNANKRLGI